MLCDIQDPSPQVTFVTCVGFVVGPDAIVEFWRQVTILVAVTSVHGCGRCWPGERSTGQTHHIHRFLVNVDKSPHCLTRPEFARRRHRKDPTEVLVEDSTNQANNGRLRAVRAATKES